jgi:hypothetical protein
MQLCSKLAVALVIMLCVLPGLSAQDLAPRAYVITPIRSNAVTLAYSFNRGDVLFDNAVPITGARGTINVASISYYRSLNLWGRSANITVSLPYTVASFRATVAGSDTQVYRSGLLDSIFRFSANLKGGPAMDLKDFLKWRQKTLLGVSLKVLTPTGQYDPTRLINPGTNRWSFKPEIGLSQRWRQWLLDTYGAVWFFTANHDFFSRNQVFSGTNTQAQSPISALEGHLSYDITGSGTWVSLDGNYWYGGRTQLNGVETRGALQANSRFGATAAVRVSKHASLKFSYSRAAFIRFGGNYQSISAAWQYSWVGKQKK